MRYPSFNTTDPTTLKPITNELLMIVPTYEPPKKLFLDGYHRKNYTRILTTLFPNLLLLALPLTVWCLWFILTHAVQHNTISFYVAIFETIIFLCLIPAYFISTTLKRASILSRLDHSIMHTFRSKSHYLFGDYSDTIEHFDKLLDDQKLYTIRQSLISIAQQIDTLSEIQSQIKPWIDIDTSDLSHDPEIVESREEIEYLERVFFANLALLRNREEVYQLSSVPPRSVYCLPFDFLRFFERNRRLIAFKANIEDGIIIANNEILELYHRAVSTHNYLTFNFNDEVMLDFAAYDTFEDLLTATFGPEYVGDTNGANNSAEDTDPDHIFDSRYDFLGHA